MKGIHVKSLFFFLLLLFIFPASSFAEKLLVIDPGHGGKFSGSTGYSGNSTGFYEKHANLLVGLKVRDLLKNTDIKVVMTRDTDKAFSNGTQADDLRERMKVANGAAAKNNDNSLFLSIHHNASPSSPYVKGLETYYYDVNLLQPDYPPDPIQVGYLSESKRFAETVHPKLISNLGSIDRRIHNDSSLYVIRMAQMPSALVELGYMTNKEEEARIKTADFQQKAAQAIANAVIEYFKVFEVHNENGKVMKTFKNKDEAIKYAKAQTYKARVFDKDKQEYIYPANDFEVYQRENGFLKAFASEEEAIAYAEGLNYTRIVFKETNRTIWSNYLDQRYDVYQNDVLAANFYDYDAAVDYSQGKAAIKIVNNKTNDVLWTNIPGVEVTKDVTISAIAGQDRIETALKVSKELYPDGFPADKQEKTVILATGFEFADALSAGPLANYYDKAPILLTHSYALDSSVKQEITRLGASKVVIIGGTVAIAKNVETELAGMNLTFERISGETRFETNLNILKKIGNLNGLFVAYGLNFPDALTVAPIAANNNWGILLVRTEGAPVLPSMNLAQKQVIITGGTQVISENVLQQLKTAYPASNIVRLAGSDRYETNAQINLQFKDSLQSNKVILTTGKDFPDALASAPLAIGTNSPLVLVGDYLNRNVESMLLEYGNDNAVNKLEVIGGVVNNQMSQTIKNKLK